MGLVIENVSGNELSVNDLGFGLASGGTIDLSLEADALAVALSGNGGDLQTLITAGDVIVKDPFDDITNLSTADGLAAVRSQNEPHWRLPPASRLADAIDVDLSAPGSYLRYDGTVFERRTPAQVASEIESDIDITNLSGYDPADNIDWTVDQGSTTIALSNLPQIPHSSLSGVIANQHIDHSTITLTAGNGMVGGGTIAASRAFSVGEGLGITVGSDNVSVNPAEVNHDSLLNYVANEHIDWTIDQSPLQINAANVPATGLSVGGVSKRMNTWTLLSGSLYYNDFAHNLDTSNLAIHVREFSNNRQVEVEYTEIIDDNTIRVVVDGNVEDLVANVISGSGPEGPAGPAGAGDVALLVNGSQVTSALTSINFINTTGDVLAVEPTTGEVDITLLTALQNDTSPSLGGTLNLNGFNITAGSATISPTELSRLDGVTSNVQTQLNSKTTATGHTHVYRIPHTWGISGAIQVASGQTGYLLPMFISLANGQTARVVSCRHKINGGTSATVTLQRNGANVTGFTAMNVTQTATTTDPVDVVLANNDQLAIVVTAVSGSPQNLSFTMFVEYTQ